MSQQSGHCFRYDAALIIINSGIDAHPLSFAQRNVVDFIRGLAFAIGFPEAPCSSFSMVSVVSFTYFSIPFTIRTQKAFSVLKLRSDLNFNTVTIFMMTNVNVPDWANFRMLTNPASRSSSRIVAKQRIFFAEMYHSARFFCIKCNEIIALFRQFSNQRSSSVWITSERQIVVRIAARILATGFTVAVHSAVGCSVGFFIVSKGSCAACSSGFPEAKVP